MQKRNEEAKYQFSCSELNQQTEEQACYVLAKHFPAPPTVLGTQTTNHPKTTYILINQTRFCSCCPW